MKKEIEELSTEEYLAAARNRVANAAAMASAYESWTDEFSRKEIRSAWSDDGYNPWERKVSIQELHEISGETLSDLGFNSWDENLRLIPLWAWNYIADGCVLTSISNDTKTKGIDEIDLDVRFGCLAYGFPATPAQSQIEEPRSGDTDGAEQRQDA
jgi:hypothetical protein